MKWAALTAAVALFLWMGRNWARLNRLGYRDLNDESIRRRFEALLPKRPQ